MNRNDGLNPAQKKAATTLNGPLLVVAGAGSGKTRVITHRILNLIAEGVPPSSILAITFTNKAASEMRRRIDRLMQEDVAINRPITMNERPFVGTFHALGAHIIREHAHLLGLTRHFSIYDRSDSKRAVKVAVQELGYDPKQYDPGIILSMISRAKGDGFGRATYRERARGPMEELAAAVWERYDAALAKEKAVDFDDLLLKSLGLLEQHENIRAHYGEVWKYIHVDEYQDTNGVQYLMVKRLAEKHHNICVVGDADQTIYTWRGATVRNILDFEKDYTDAEVITLDENYRSTGNIIAAANDIISKNVMRHEKTLRTSNAAGEKISLIVSYSEEDEARAVVDRIKNLVTGGARPEEIAVLYRANFQSRALEEMCIKKSLPYQLVGTKFFERAEVKSILSYIRASLNRDSAADISRIINVPPRGVGKVTLAKILSGQANELPSAMKARLSGFYTLLDNIRTEIQTSKPSELIKFAARETGLERMYSEGTYEDEERLLNIRELASVATQYDHMMPEDGIEALLANASLATDQDDLEKNEPAVKLMTVHASKGLEFDHVFIVGLEEDLFPFKHIDDGGVSKEEAEEERRLFYVALTRARIRAYLSHTMVRTIYGSRRVAMPSQFIADIEKDLIEENLPDKPEGVKAIFIDF